MILGLKCRWRQIWNCRPIVQGHLAAACLHGRYARGFVFHSPLLWQALLEAAWYRRKRQGVPPRALWQDPTPGIDEVYGSFENVVPFLFAESRVRRGFWMKSGTCRSWRLEWFGPFLRPTSPSSSLGGWSISTIRQRNCSAKTGEQEQTVTENSEIRNCLNHPTDAIPFQDVRQTMTLERAVLNQIAVLQAAWRCPGWKEDAGQAIWGPRAADRAVLTYAAKGTVSVWFSLQPLHSEHSKEYGFLQMQTARNICMLFSTAFNSR